MCSLTTAYTRTKQMWAHMNSGTDDDASQWNGVAPPHEPPASKGQLPVEVWEHVLDYLHHDRETLQASSLACRAWVPMTRRLLFAEVELHSREELLRFRCAVEISEASGTNIARLVQSIAFIGVPLCRLQVPNATRDSLLNDVFSKLYNVTSLRLENVSVDIVLPLGSRFAVVRSFTELFPFPSLQKLHLSSVIFRAPHDILRLVSAFPRLAVLDASQSVWPQHPDPVPSPFTTSKDQDQADITGVKNLHIDAEPAPAQFLQWRRTLRLLSIERLEWSAYAVEYKHWVEKVLHDCAPKVEVLRLRAAYDSDGASYITPDSRRGLTQPSSTSER